MYRCADKARAHKCIVEKRIVSYWPEATASNAPLGRAEWAGLVRSAGESIQGGWRRRLVVEPSRHPSLARAHQGRPAACRGGADGLAAQDFGHPVGDVMASVDAVVQAGALHVAFTLGENLLLSLWTIN
jgi:hypothetical protein